MDHIRNYFKVNKKAVLLTLGIFLFALFAAANMVHAATTIGTNIDTGGTLSVTGASTLTGNVSAGGTLAVTGATTLSADVYSTDGALFNIASTTAFLIQSGSGTEVLKVDTTNAGLKVTGAATTTLYAMIGTGGTVNTLNYTGGDFYVQDGFEADGLSALADARIVVVNATTTVTDNLKVGTDAAITDITGSGLSISGGALTVTSPSGSWDAFSANVLRPTNTSAAILVNAASSTITQLITNRATSTGIWVGSAGVANNIDLSNDLYVQGDLEVDGTFYPAITAVSGAFTAGGGFGSSGVTLGDTGIIQADGALYANALFSNVASTTAINVQDGSGNKIFEVDTATAVKGVKITGQATTTSNAVFGVATWAAPTSTLTVIGGAHVFSGTATSSDAIWVGSGGVADNINLLNDLYVQDGLEVDGGSWLNNATTTDSLSVGSNSLGQLSVTQGAATRAGLVIQAAASPTANLFAVYNSSGAFLSGFTAAGGLLMNVSSTTALRIQSAGTEVFSVNTANADVKGATITGQATTTSNFVAGASVWAAPTNTATIVGSLYATGKATTTGKTLTVGTPNEPSTTTVKVLAGTTRNGCIQLTKNAVDYRVYIDTAGTGLKVEAGPCDNNE